MVLACHRKFKEFVDDEEKLIAFVRFAADRFGEAYDRDEVARITARIVGSILLKDEDQEAVARDKEYICFEFMEESYSSFVIDFVPTNDSFVTSADFAADKYIQLFAVLRAVPSQSSFAFVLGELGAGTPYA